MNPMIKSLIKRFLYFIAPRRTTEWMSARARAHSHGVAKQWGCGEIAELTFAQLGDRVLEGPFAGLRLSEATRLEHVTPYLLGTYESELESAWQAILTGSYDRIFDIGAKFGYYAVGLARRFPAAVVTAFDTDPWARDAVREMSKANGVDNVHVRGYCDTASFVAALASSPSEAPFIISDCEGYEAELFAGSALQYLQTAVMIIETHDDLVAGVTQELSGRLAPTHALFTIHDNEGRRTSTQPLEFLTASQKELAVSEVRPRQSWLICFPKSGKNAGLAEHYQATRA